MGRPAGESEDGFPRVDFDRYLRLEFRDSRITSGVGLLAYRELDDVPGLTDLAGEVLSVCWRGKNTRHLLTGLFRQSVLGRPAGYEDANNAERLAHDPATGVVVDRSGLERSAASISQMGRHRGTPSIAAGPVLSALITLSTAGCRPGTSVAIQAYGADCPPLGQRWAAGRAQTAFPAIQPLQNAWNGG